MRNCSENFLRARQALEFSHSQDPLQTFAFIKIDRARGRLPRHEALHGIGWGTIANAADGVLRKGFA